MQNKVIAKRNKNIIQKNKLKCYKSVFTMLGREYILAKVN